MRSYGLVNAPATFMDLMNRVFRGYVDKLLSSLLTTFWYKRELWRSMSYVWRLYWRSSRGKKLYAKFSKCEFWLGKVTFLGHVVSKEGIFVDP